MTFDDADLPPELRAALDTGRVNRRTLFRGAGLAGTAAVLAACGVKGTAADSSNSTSTTPSSSSADTSPAGSGQSGSGPAGSSGSAAPPAGSSAPSGTSTGQAVPDRSDSDRSDSDRSDSDKVVSFSNWPEYIDVDPKNATQHPTLLAFTAKTGIKVNYTEDVNDNNQYFAKIQPQLAAGRAITADVFVVTDWMVSKLIQLGYLQKLDKANIPNARNINPSLVDVPFDPGREYSLTWQSGLAGIAQNPKVTKGRSVDSVDQLLTDPALKGKVTLLTEMRDTVGLTLLDLGYDCADFTDEQFTKAIAKLQKAVDAKQIRQFTGNDYASGLVSGDIGACLAWTGDVVQLKADNPDLSFVLPTAGFTLWSDNLVIPVGTPHKKNAEILMNYYYQAPVAAQVADTVNYITPVQGVKEVLAKTDPAVADNTLIFPTAVSLAKAHGFMKLDQAQEKRYNAAFAKLSGT